MISIKSHLCVTDFRNTNDVCSTAQLKAKMCADFKLWQVSKFFFRNFHEHVVANFAVSIFCFKLYSFFVAFFKVFDFFFKFRKDLSSTLKKRKRLALLGSIQNSSISSFKNIVKL